MQKQAVLLSFPLSTKIIVSIKLCPRFVGTNVTPILAFFRTYQALKDPAPNAIW